MIRSATASGLAAMRSGGSCPGVRVGATVRPARSDPMTSRRFIESAIGLEDLFVMVAGVHLVEDLFDPAAVSYTHLDVYKRQGYRLSVSLSRFSTPCRNWSDYTEGIGG